ncbi:Rossmann-fold NAD(P)-binding domain-containing protein [Nonomuraea turcica]|uniref:hypothetical protein n=1 Tax=Nonomuraea sp. G32 TaxID=3067274 RepID=UPI00273BEBF1|nr:hypothetical protein [Nonomuraea sp. G32]MDP4502336.1 hypothetical protein [Nonomuraea sp. G32]
MKILVIGASGKTGRPVVEALEARGVEVRAARRAPVPAGVLFDWADPGTWQEALRDVDALYVVGPYMYPDRPALVGDLLAAAPHARRVVLLSVLAADAAVGFVDARDVAEVAAAALTEDGHADRIHVLTGPEALTYAQVTRVLGEAAGRELQYTALDADEHVAGMRAAGLDERSVMWQQGLFQLIRDGHNAVVTDTVERVTGHPARSLDSYARENAATWRPAVPAER